MAAKHPDSNDNYKRLEQLQETVVQINAHHSNPIISLSKKARVMLTRNLWTEAGLCNGTMGTIKDIIFSEIHKATTLPIAIIVQFDNDYLGPRFGKDAPSCVPIFLSQVPLTLLAITSPSVLESVLVSPSTVSIKTRMVNKNPQVTRLNPQKVLD